jgi:hypothetical protein
MTRVGEEKKEELQLVLYVKDLILYLKDLYPLIFPHAFSGHLYISQIIILYPAEEWNFSSDIQTARRQGSGKL